VSAASRAPGGRGAFIVFEGGEGSGKSTVASLVAARLEEEDVRVVLTREPGGTVTGEKVRRILHERLSPWGEVFAFLLARAQLVDEVVEPALSSGAIVLCDRYEASTFAYQGYGRGLSLESLREANALATRGLKPDLTVLLDIEPALGMKRKHGETEIVATGKEALAFHERVRSGYLEQLESAPRGSWLRIDATKDLDAVYGLACEAVRARSAQALGG
jgi:dTMP kinase